MSYHPFEEHKKQLEAIPHNQRGQFLKEVLKTPQLPGEPTVHKIAYPHESSFQFKEFTLNYHYSGSTASPKAIVVFFHGLYGYGGNSGYLAVNITNAIPDVNFYSLDFHNFGKSKGDCPGYIHSFEWLVEQGLAFVDHLLEQMEEKPMVFLVGESLGGAVVFKMNLTEPQRFNGVIFINPALREIKHEQFYKKKLAKMLGYLAPKLKLFEQSYSSSTKYDTQKLMRANDLTYNGKHIPGSVRVALNGIQEVEKCYKSFKTNYILFQGGVDKAVDLFAPLDFEKECQSKDKTTIYIKSMWHSTFFEEEVKDVTELAIAWLSKRI